MVLREILQRTVTRFEILHDSLSMEHLDQTGSSCKSKADCHRVQEIANALNGHIQTRGTGLPTTDKVKNSAQVVQCKGLSRRSHGNDVLRHLVRFLIAKTQPAAMRVANQIEFLAKMRKN